MGKEDYGDMGKERVGIVKRVLVEFRGFYYGTGINYKCGLGNIFV